MLSISRCAFTNDTNVSILMISYGFVFHPEFFYGEIIHMFYFEIYKQIDLV